MRISYDDLDRLTECDYPSGTGVKHFYTYNAASWLNNVTVKQGPWRIWNPIRLADYPTCLGIAFEQIVARHLKEGVRGSHEYGAHFRVGGVTIREPIPRVLPDQPWRDPVY